MLPTPTLLLLGALAPQGAPAYDAEWIGFDTSFADTARWPWNFAAGDLDGDGDTDYAVALGASIPGLSLLFNEGAGSFAPPVTVPSAAGVFWDEVHDVELVDLDLDGDLDAVVSNPGNTGTGSRVAVHENLGGGTFAPYVLLPAGPGPLGLASADLDGDGWPDVAAANYGYIGQGSTVSVLFNDGAGGLLAPVSVPVGSSPRRVTPGDLDGDGDADLVVALEDEALVVLVNDGRGSFTATTYEVFPSPNAGTLHAAAELGDLDGDGDLDVVYTSTKCDFDFLPGTGAVAVLENLGDGSLAAPVALTTPIETQGGAELALADWTGDGRLDIASAHEFDGEWVLFASQGPGLGFGPAQLFAATASAIAVDGSDVTGDGRPDVVVLGRDSLELAVYKNRGDGDFHKNPAWPFLLTLPGIFDPIVADGLDAADVDGDGDLDLGTAWFKIQGLDGGQALLLNAGDGTFPDAMVFQTPVGAANFAFAELNGDGWPDMISTDATQGAIRRRMNLGGTFGPEAKWPFVAPTALDPGDLIAFDADDDGDNDVVGAASDFLGIRLNDGTGDLGGALLFHDLSTFVSVVANGDLDGDGTQDVVTNSSFIGIEASLGNGDATFQAPIGSFADWGVKGIALADLDKDGFLDAATSAWSDDDHDHPTIQVLLGWGDGAFKIPATYLGSHEIGTASNAGDIVAVDADGDGDLDLATGNYWSLDVTYLENQGDGTYAPQQRYGVGGEAFGTVAGDFDGDGFDDVVVGTTTGPAIDFFPAAVLLPSTGGGAWADLGSGLAGAAGVPRLTGTALVPGEPVTVALADAAPSAPALLVFGLGSSPLPFFGGTLLPSLDVVIGVATDASGAGSITVPWSTALPPGLQLVGQAAVADAGAPLGVALSNAALGTQY